MGKKLVIVESPHKATTISKYLGKDYEVVSSKGHVRDLSTKGKYGFGVDIEKVQSKSILQPTLTVREKQLLGIYMMH